MRHAPHICIVVAAFIAAGAFALPALASKKDNSVRFASAETLTSVDPNFTNVRTGMIVADSVWDTLIYWDPESGQYKGNLATSWRWIDDKTLELDLRERVKFHNGAEFTAGDVVYTLTVVSRPESKAFPARVRWIERVEKAGTHRVRTITKPPFPAAVAFLKFLVGEGAARLDAPCHPSQFGCSDAGVPRYSYDPALSRRLLAEAGFQNGFDLDLFAWRDRNQTEAIIGYLVAVGIKARLRFMQNPAVRDAVRAGKVGMADTMWGTVIGDASNSVSMFHEFSNDDMNRDPEVRDLLVRGDNAMDEAVRKEAYGKALRLIAERAYALPLYSLSVYYAAAKGLVFDPPDDATPRFYEMSWK